MKKINKLDAYDYVRQVIRNLTGYDNIRRDDKLVDKPRLGFDSKSLKLLRSSVLARFNEVNPDQNSFSNLALAACKTVEDVLNAIWASIPDAHKEL